jgi:carboxyl-terminal processing protease
MWEGLDGILPGSEVLARLMVDSAWKGSIIFAAAGVATLVMRRAKASARHLVWLSAAIAGLCLPVLSSVLPSWTLADWTVPSNDDVARPSIASKGTSSVSPGRLAAAQTFSGAGVRIAEADAARGAQPEPPPAANSARETLARWTRLAPRWDLLAAIWSSGACLAMLPTIVGVLSLWRLGKTAQPISRGPVAHRLGELVQELGVRRPIRLLQTPEREIPMTWGAMRPVILLPESANFWTEERIEMVLLHELAHVARGDFWTQLVARAACVAHWFNPLAWLALNRLRAEQERACDDLALDHGLDAAEYAGHLLTIITRSHRARALAPAMASSSQVEGRLRAILDPRRDRRPLTRRSVCAIGLGAALVVIPLASGQIRVAEAARLDNQVEKLGHTLASPQTPSPGKENADVIEQLRALFVKPLDEATLVNGAIKGMVQALDDPNSAFLPPGALAEIERRAMQTMTGIGAQLASPKGKLIVRAPLADSPAEAAGIRAGDVILEIQGAPTQGMSLHEAVQAIIGPAGSAVTLKLEHSGEAPRSVTVTRRAIEIRTVEGVQRGEAGRWEWMIDPERKIGYARVTEFANKTPHEMRDALQALMTAGMKGFIFDLRGCPGGVLSAAVEVANLFLPGGTIVSTRGRGEVMNVIAADPRKAIGDFPMAILVNEQTASAAEVVAGALQDHKRAVLIGTRTYGKGSIQSIVKLKDGAAVKLTTAYYNLPGGRNIDRTAGKATWGVDPTEGDFVPMELRRLDQILLTARLAREQRGQGPGIAEDVQLAAAQKALSAKLTTGQYVTVGQPLPAVTEHARRLEEVRKRREGLLKDLERVDQELSAIGQLPLPE